MICIGCGDSVISVGGVVNFDVGWLCGRVFSEYIFEGLLLE